MSNTHNPRDHLLWIMLSEYRIISINYSHNTSHHQKEFSLCSIHHLCSSCHGHLQMAIIHATHPILHELRKSSSLAFLILTTLIPSWWILLSECLINIYQLFLQHRPSKTKKRVLFFIVIPHPLYRIDDLCCWSVNDVFIDHSHNIAHHNIQSACLWWRIRLSEFLGMFPQSF